jgi:hypothetical protein
VQGFFMYVLSMKLYWIIRKNNILNVYVYYLLFQEEKHYKVSVNGPLKICASQRKFDSS